MYNRDLLRLVPQNTINLALKIDAEALSTQPRVFQKENAEMYDVAINTWILCVRDFAPYAWTHVVSRIGKFGLAGTVKYFTDAASLFLSQEDMTEYPLAVSLLKEIQKNYSARSVLTDGYSTLESVEGIFLFLCRYLKRLTPQYADKLDMDATKEFKENQKRLKFICRRGYNPLIIDMCRREVDAGILRRRARDYSYILMKDIELSPGTCFSLKGTPLRTTFAKYQSLIDEYGYDQIDVWRRSVWQYELGETARLMTVPKSFSSARTIAPEECLRQAISHRMFSLRGVTPEGIHLEDQTINQSFARQGSIDGTYCTIDLSHASDDVTWLLVQEIYGDFPLYLSYLERIRPKYVIVDKQPILLQSFATMGNSMTFLVESEIFYIITKAAVHFAQRCGVNCDDTVVVYGDDIIAASEAYPFIEAFLTTLGFSLNEKKSYWTGAFRESCGKDFIYGVDVTSPYFPRRPLTHLLDWYRDKNGVLNTVAESLISLQHRLMNVSPVAAQYIEIVIREHKSDLGIAPIGTQSTDLWGYDLIPYKSRYIPEYVRQMTSARNPWIFAHGSWHYSPVKTKYVRTLIQDEIHKVSLQFRPTVELEKKSLPDSILYLQYLAHGPLYLSDYDADMGISTSRRSLPTGSPESTWKTFEI